MKDDRKDKLEALGFAWQGLKGARKKNASRKAAPPPPPVEDPIHQPEEDAFDGMPFQQMNVARAHTGAPLPPPQDATGNQQNFNENAMLARLNAERGNFQNGMPPNNPANFNDNSMFARLNAQRVAPQGGEMMNNQVMMNNPHQGMMNNPHQGMMNNQVNFNDNTVLTVRGPMPGGIPNNNPPGFNDNAVLARLHGERRPPAPGEMMNTNPPPGFNENQVDRYAYQHLLQFAARPGARFYG